MQLVYIFGFLWTRETEEEKWSITIGNIKIKRSDEDLSSKFQICCFYKQIGFPIPPAG